MKGIEVRVDLADVSPVLLTDAKKMAEICKEAAIEAGATVRAEAFASLGDESPPGLTVAILLDESHITAHSYSEEGLLALNAFTCGSKASAEKAIRILMAKIGGTPTFGPEVTPRFGKVLAEKI